MEKTDLALKKPYFRKQGKAVQSELGWSAPDYNLKNFIKKRLKASSLQSIFYSVNEHQPQCGFSLENNTCLFCTYASHIPRAIELLFCSIMCALIVCRWFWYLETQAKLLLFDGEPWFCVKMPSQVVKSSTLRDKVIRAWMPSHKQNKTRGWKFPIFIVYSITWTNTSPSCALLQKSKLAFFPPRPQVNEPFHCQMLCVHILLTGGFSSLKPTQKVFSHGKTGFAMKTSFSSQVGKLESSKLEQSSPDGNLTNTKKHKADIFHPPRLEKSIL